jgi:hypothetical protein
VAQAPEVGRAKPRSTAMVYNPVNMVADGGVPW